MDTPNHVLSMAVLDAKLTRLTAEIRAFCAEVERLCAQLAAQRQTNGGGQ
jgi:uncharacterized small protein (DUF1192 family)